MKVLVCGGRDYRDYGRVSAALDLIDPRITSIIEGGARGADTLAREWARSRGIPCKTFSANWQKYKKAAGPIRNQWMLDEGKPDLVVAFPTPQSVGTWDMIEKARAAGVETRVYEYLGNRTVDGQ